jgi:Uma2 family endonuclease
MHLKLVEMETITEEKISVAECRNTYLEADDDAYYELMEGRPLKKSAPSPMHQSVVGNLRYAMKSFDKEKKLGKFLCSPIDVFLDEYNKFQPDIIFIPSADVNIITVNGIEGTPELVVEVLSPSSVMHDRIHKKRVYQRSGVSEYWLVSPEYNEIEVFVLENGKYELFSAATVIEGGLKSKVLDGLVLNLKEIFE